VGILHLPEEFVKKIAHNVALHIFLPNLIQKLLQWIKVVQNLVYFLNFQKLLTSKQSPDRRKAPNLVALVLAHNLRNYFRHLNHQQTVAITPNCRVARFFLVRDAKTGKMYQMNTKCNEW
jgi:hypothetical protein